MKIYFYINELGGGGAERVIANLASAFSNHGYEAGIVTSYPISGEYAVSDGVKRYNLEHERIQTENPIKRNVRRIKLLRQILKKEKPDVLITFMAEPNYRGVIASFGLKTKTIISVRNDPDREYSSKLDKLLAKYLLPMASGCVFQTEDAKKWFPKRLQKKSRVIFNAVRGAFFSVDRQPKKNEIVACGRLEPQKNYPMLIHCMEDVVKACPEAVLKIYGKGNLEEELKGLVESVGLSQNILFMGATDQVEKVLAEAGVFVLPSDYEGMPNALMEAIAAGVPCVSTDCPCGGPRAIIRQEENGILVKVGDRKAFAAAIIRLLKNEKEAQEMGAAARASAKRFDAEAVFSQWEELVLYVTN